MAQGNFGIKIEDPQWVEIQRNDQINQYLDAIRSDVDPKYIDFAIVVLGRKDLKPQIKALLD